MTTNLNFKDHKQAYEMARQVLAGYDLQPKHIQLVKVSFNTVFRVDTADGASYCLRFNRHGLRSRQEIENELAWIQALAQDDTLRVPRPKANANGDFLLEVARPELESRQFAVLFEWLPGRHCNKRLSPSVAYQLGKTMAKLHKQALGWTAPHPTANRQLDQVWFFGNFPAASSYSPEQQAEWFPSARLALLERASEQVKEVLATLYTQPEGLRLLHADMHPGNIKMLGQQLYLLDFDDSLRGFPIQDISTSLYYLYFYPHSTELRAAFQRGYSAVCDWPEQYPGQIEDLMIGRELTLLSFVLNANDPAYLPRISGWLSRAEERLKIWLGDPAS